MNDKPYSIRQDQQEEYKKMILNAMEQAKDQKIRFTTGWASDLINNGWPVRLQGSEWVPYRGINIIWLNMFAVANGFTSNQFATIRGWKRLHGDAVKAKENQKATISIFAMPSKGSKTDPKTGDVEEFAYYIYKCNYVYNRDQIEGLPVESKNEIEDQLIEFNHEVTEQYLNAQNVKVTHGHNGAFYNSNDDYIGMPDKTSFTGTDQLGSMETYYSTLCHEHVHATGHKSRLARPTFTKKTRTGKADYALEELVAEIGSALLCAKLGILADPQNQLKDHGAYLNGWIKHVKESKAKALFSSFAKATAAIEYMDKQQGNNQLELDVA
tara:strand:+ start:23 stop:1000 length:978 start_codon:yes stop_codon:yes gene_type:complete